LTAPAASPRRRPVLRAVIAVIGFYLLGALLVALLLLPFAGQLLTGVSPTEMAENPTPAFALAQGLTSLLAFGAATWVVGRIALRLGARELRWRSRLGWARGLGVGLAFGILPAAVVMTLGLFTAGAGWVRDGGSLADWTTQVGKTVLLLAPAALSEELMFRGLPMVIIAGVFGRSRTILLLSILFAMAHATNPGVTVSGLGNIALAGLLLSLAFYSPGGMWTAFGAHLGWNSTLAALGAPVSGLPFDIPFIDYTMGSPTWLTGGRFGPEGGLLGTLVLAGAVVLAAIWVRKEPT
jgi:membrane protease YdiL (CAAX protease family)